jgi:HEAT repeat protein
LILIGAAIVLAAVVVWQWAGGDDGDDATFRRIEKLADKGDQAALAEEASVKDVKVACRAVRAMGRVGRKAMGGIRVAMKDKRPAVREVAVLAAGQAGDEKDLPALSAIVATDKSPAVRAAAALSLGRMRAYTEMETLLNAMADDDENVRRRANAAIEKILGGGVAFKASASPEKRRRDIASMRALCKRLERPTEQFYEARKRREKAARKGRAAQR